LGVQENLPFFYSNPSPLWIYYCMEQSYNCWWIEHYHFLFVLLYKNIWGKAIYNKLLYVSCSSGSCVVHNRGTSVS
jgi:hypothetical protein